MSLSGDAVNEIARLAQEAHEAADKVVEIDGVRFSTVQLYELRKKDPEPAALKVTTLQGIVDYVKENRDGLKLEQCLLHIDGPQAVHLYGPLQGHFQQRFHYLDAIAPDRLKAAAFAFGQYQPHGDFITALLALFDTQGERDATMALLRRVKMTSGVQLEDDGRTQAVQASKGVSLVENVSIPNAIPLAPFRTFAEVEQPLSDFVLRVQHSEQYGFRTALFEADGGAWRLTAVERIRAWLTEQLADDQGETTIAIIG